MVLARVSFWQFKEGKRPEAFAELDRILNTLAKTSEGFRGYMSLLSYDKTDAATILTLWQDEVALKKSKEEVFKHAINSVREYLVEEPRIENCRVYSTQLFQHNE